MVPDVDIAAHVGRDFFLDEKFPRHESGQGYVRVVEHSVMWKETAASKIFTYQGSTTCTEVDQSWTIMSSAYSHLRQGGEKDASELKTLIRAEVEQQECLKQWDIDLRRGDCYELCNPLFRQYSCKESRR